MRNRTARAALSSFRRWWLELTVAAILGLIASAPTHGAAFLAAFMAAFIIVGWLMCVHHGRLPLHEKLDRIADGVADLVDEVRADRDGDPVSEPGPALSLVRNRD